MFRTRSSLRQLFTIILAYSEPRGAPAPWDQLRWLLSKDFVYQRAEAGQPSLALQRLPLQCCTSTSCCTAATPHAC